MRVDVAKREDFEPWLRLAEEVEHLFGPLVSDPRYHRALMRNIDRGTAFCIRQDDGQPGSPLLAGMLFSARPHIYKISWFAVTERRRRHGLASAVMKYVFDQVQPPAELSVITFGPDVAGGEPARHFYEAAGFTPGETSPRGANGQSRQVFRMKIP